MTDNLTLKEINSLKKKISWGEIPPFFHMISTSIADLEGIHTHGFEHALKTLINRENWNLDRLEGKMNRDGEIVVSRKPQLALYKRFSNHDYEIQCAPISQGGPVMVYAKGDPFIDFRVWEPARMGNILRIPKFEEFIVHAYKKGDEADRSLIRYASRIIEDLLAQLAQEIEIIEDYGQSIKEIVQEIEGTIDPNS